VLVFETDAVDIIEFLRVNFPSSWIAVSSLIPDAKIIATTHGLWEETA
jgi:hypothetical protein